jgi:hypothetical protein
LKLAVTPNVLKGNQDQQALARLNDLADFDRLLGHHAIHRRNNGGVAQFQLGRFQVGVRLSDPSNRSSSIGCLMGICLWLARACSTPARAWSTLALAANIADLEISAPLSAAVSWFFAALNSLSATRAPAR